MNDTNANQNDAPVEADGVEPPEPDKPPRKVWKWVRPKKFKIADKKTLEQILNPPPRYPKPEFKGQDYVHGSNNESPYIFMCNEPNCSAKFTTDLGLTLHSKKHNDPNLKCSCCGMTFKTEPDLTKHTAEFHPNLEVNPDANPLQCKKCSKCSRDVKALWRHVRESHRERNWPCPHCNFPFTRPENLKQHLQTQHLEEGQESKHACTICGKEYRHKASLRGHIRLRHRGESSKSYRCVICDTLYYNVQSYNLHMRRHANPQFFPCHICNVKFRSSSHLQRHENSHAHIYQARKAKRKQLNIEFPVPVIKTVTTYNPNLTKEELVKLCKKTSVKIILHKVDQHVAERSTAKIAKRKAVTRKKSQKERREGVKEKMPVDNAEETTNQYLNCIYCEKQLPSLEAVKVHEKVCLMKMRNPKLHICHICNREFEKPYKLKLHLRTHFSERPFKCNYCSSFFKNRHTKFMHEKSAHFDIRYKPKCTRVYRCNHVGCHKQYKNSTSLKEHVAMDHLGIRHPCEKCGRIFRCEKNLKNHLRHVHAECPILLECKPCKRTYKAKQTYLAHLQRKRHARKTREYERRQKRKDVTGTKLAT